MPNLLPPEERPVVPGQIVHFDHAPVTVEVPAALPIADAGEKEPRGDQAVTVEMPAILPIARLRLAVKEQHRLEAGQAGIALAFDLTAVDAQGKGISRFAAPLTVTLRLGTAVNWASRPDWLRPWVGYWDEAARCWVPIAPVRLDEAAGEVTFTTDHLSVFGAGTQGVMVSGWVLTLTDAQVEWDAPDRAETRYWYDAAGNLIAVRDGLGNVTRIATYNLRGLPTGVAGQSPYLTGATYNALGQPLQQTWGNTRVTTYAYHPQNLRLTQLAVWRCGNGFQMH